MGEGTGGEGDGRAVETAVGVSVTGGALAAEGVAGGGAWQAIRQNNRRSQAVDNLKQCWYIVLVAEADTTRL
jgi:hypothetical protein